jgi:hypothetical protein
MEVSFRRMSRRGYPMTPRQPTIHDLSPSSNAHKAFRVVGGLPVVSLLLIAGSNSIHDAACEILAFAR